MRMGCGVDSCEIPRIEKIMKKTGFVSRWFAPEEQDYFAAKRMHPQTVAGHFAAKEAFSKAMGTGIRGFRLQEVAVVHDELGQPSLRLTGGAARLAEGWRFALSITHTADTATAFVVAWREDEA